MPDQPDHPSRQARNAVRDFLCERLGVTNPNTA
jgi:hypothetical protein